MIFLLSFQIVVQLLFKINIKVLMKSVLKIEPQKIKKASTFDQEVPTNTPKFFPKKSFHIEIDSKDLRETDTTISSSPKNKKSVSISDFSIVKFLGNGKFGSVYLVKHIQTGVIYAMKIIKKSMVNLQKKQESLKLINQLIREIKIQMFLNHPNIIKLYYCFADEYKIYLLMEPAPDGQLYEYMKDGLKFSEETTSFLIRQILLGVRYMHQNHVIHRDLKPQNIVMTYGIPKICDFGWSVYCPKEFRTTLCGTPLYLSPQILMGESYNQKIDSWAVGTLTYELLYCENPFRITKKSEISKIVTQQLSMNDGSMSCKSFLNLALQKQPQKRLSSLMMLEHPFITKFAQLQTSEQMCKLITKFYKQKNKPKAQHL